MTPLERTEALYRELVAWYGEGAEREQRAASKLLMVALLKLKEHGGQDWRLLVEDHLNMLEKDPERYLRMLESNRGGDKSVAQHPDSSGSLIA